MKTKILSIDIIASTSSFLCAFHCISIPVILSFSSLNSLRFLDNQYLEWSFIILGLFFIISSLWPSYKKKHHKIKPLLFAIIGFAFILIGKLDFTETWEILNTVIGSSFVCFAHYLNWNFLKNLVIR
tara:strand:+ start:740 stop:1120 length:381 start_codon:yes stop_codon:yes gene_type:complete